MFISSAIIIIDNDCGVFVVLGIHRAATNRGVNYNQQDMDYVQEKITVSIMKQQIDLEMTMDTDKFLDQLVDGRKSDDEGINSVITLTIPCDSRLCSLKKTQLLSFFCRTYFMDNLVKKGFENNHELIYTKYTDNVRHWSQGKDLFSHDKVFVPIHIVDSRFILAVIFIQDKLIDIYDMVQSDDAAIRYQAILLRYLKKEYHHKHGTTLPDG